MDPSAEEEKHQKGLLVVSYMPSINEVTHVLQTGETEGSVTVQVIYLPSSLYDLLAWHAY